MNRKTLIGIVVILATLIFGAYLYENNYFGGIIYKRLRPEQILDAQDIVTINLKTKIVNYISKDSIDFLTSEKRTQENVDYFRDAVNDPKYYFLGAFDKDRLVGFALFYIFNETQAFLSQMFILPEYHQQGIGSKLMNKGIEHFKVSVSEAKTVLVNVKKRNEQAKRFYRKHGFVFFRENPELDYHVITMIRMLGLMRP